MEARAAGSQRVARYGVNDGAGRSVDIQTSPGCATGCTPPQTIANFLGSLPHGNEINLLTVDEVTPAVLGVGGEMAVYCGDTNALSCYFPDENRMVISGHDFTDPNDNATRDYVLAHEYGHHIANHRNNAPFANPAVDWGPKRWASFAGVCKGVGMAATSPATRPSATTTTPARPGPSPSPRTPFRPSRCPGSGPTSQTPTSRVASPRSSATPSIPGAARPPRSAGADFPQRRKPRKKVKRFQTPNDGDFTLRLSGPDRANLDLRLRGPDSTLVEDSDGAGSQRAAQLPCLRRAPLHGDRQRHGRRHVLPLLPSSTGQVP